MKQYLIDMSCVCLTITIILTCAGVFYNHVFVMPDELKRGMYSYYQDVSFRLSAAEEKVIELDNIRIDQGAFIEKLNRSLLIKHLVNGTIPSTWSTVDQTAP